MRRTILLSCSIASFIGAVVVFVPGVIWTKGTYGSRMAWLLGVVLPLLLLTAVFSWLAAPGTPVRRIRPDHRTSPASVGVAGVPKVGGAKKLFVVSATLFAIPFVLAAVLLLVYAALFLRDFLLH